MKENASKDPINLSTQVPFDAPIPALGVLSRSDQLLYISNEKVTHVLIFSILLRLAVNHISVHRLVSGKTEAWNHFIVEKPLGLKNAKMGKSKNVIRKMYKTVQENVYQWNRSEPW